MTIFGKLPCHSVKRRKRVAALTTSCISIRWFSFYKQDQPPADPVLVHGWFKKCVTESGKALNVTN